MGQRNVGAWIKTRVGGNRSAPGPVGSVSPDRSGDGCSGSGRAGAEAPDESKPQLGAGIKKRKFLWSRDGHRLVTLRSRKDFNAFDRPLVLRD